MENLDSHKIKNVDINKYIINKSIKLKTVAFF